MTETDRTVIESLSLPRLPPPSPRAPFPLLAVMAPLAGAAVLFAVMRSPIMLAFAALSPIIALAGTVDGRLAARRRRRLDARAYAASAERFLETVASAHDRERTARSAEHPPASALLGDGSHRPRRWTGGGRVTELRVGTGSAVSTLLVSGGSDTESDRALLARARTLADAPITVDPAHGVGVVGVIPAARALVRGWIVQLSHAHPPGVLAIGAPRTDAYDWLDDYPHVTHAAPLRVRLVDPLASVAPGAEPALLPISPSPTDAAGEDGIMIAVAERLDDLPAGCRVVMAIDPDGALALLTASDAPGDVVGELVTAQEAAAFGRTLAVAARTRGLTPARRLPARLGFAELAGHRRGRPLRADSAAGLRAVVGISAAGPLVIDLAASGPHAIVTGTTGSGKSELLISWVLAMAAEAGPSAVGFLLVDFKGGTAFRRLESLPHTVGVVTDLTHGEASRALKSLGAELRRREAALAAAGVSDVTDAGAALGRLVIVVDEAAAMLAAFPELSAMFVDIAARGRALGVHLVLGTQRATGVLGDALVANCALRMSLRLASASDSTALLGSDAAARLPHGVPGRLIVARDGELITAQAATAGSDDVAAVAAASAHEPRPAAPWLPALPASIPLDAFGRPPSGAVVIGARDDPDRQVQDGILYRPDRAHLLMLGARGSGKSTAARAVLAQWRGETIVVPADLEAAWDALVHAEARAQAGGDRPCLVVIDDVDALIDRFDDEHRDAVVDRIRALLVDGPRTAVAVLCTAAVLPGGLRGAAARFGERLVLRQSDRQDHVLAGAPAELYDADAPPGRGVWRDRLAQVVCVEPDDGGFGRVGPVTAPSPLGFAPGSTTIVVARAPRATAARLAASSPAVRVLDLSDRGARPDAPATDAPGAAPDALGVRAGDEPVAIVGDPEAWQRHWALLERLRPHASLVFDGCSLAQVRAVLHSRVLPPVVAPGHALVRDPAGEFSRVRMSA